MALSIGTHPGKTRVGGKLIFAAQFTYAAGDANSAISTWSTTLRLAHSALTRKYRILMGKKNGTSIAANRASPTLNLSS
jgi:hypothetical protein